MKKKIKLRHIINSLWILVSALLSAGCSSRLPEQPDTSGEDIVMSFTLLSGKIRETSRADEFHPETGSEYALFEDGMDLEDTGIFLFAAAGEDPADLQLVLKSSSLGNEQGNDITVRGMFGNYNVTMNVRKRLLRQRLGLTDDDPDPEKLTLRLLVVSNCSSTTDHTQTLEAVASDTFSGVTAELQGWNYSMSEIYNPDGGPEVETVYSAAKEMSPMFGTIVSTVDKQVLSESSPEERLFFGTINMLRALAKIRIIDNISEKNADGYPMIVSASVLGSQSELKILPSDVSNYENGQQVHQVNIADISSTLPTAAGTFSGGIISDSQNMTPSSERKGKTFVCYAPEQQISGTVAGVDANPVIRIEVAMEKDEEGTPVIKTFNVPMSGYGTVVFGFGNSLLRNHIYMLSVKGINSDGPTVKARIVPWEYNRDHIEL